MLAKITILCNSWMDFNFIPALNRLLSNNPTHIGHGSASIPLNRAIGKHLESGGGPFRDTSDKQTP